MDIGNPNSSQVIVSNNGDVIQVNEISHVDLAAKTKITNPLHLRRQSDDKYFCPGVIITTDSKFIKHKIVEIGVWNMFTTQSLNVAHGLGAKWSNVVSIDGFVRNDTDTYHLWSAASNPTTKQPIWSIGLIDGTNISLDRSDGLLTVGGDFTTLGTSRGQLIITYFE